MTEETKPSFKLTMGAYILGAIIYAVGTSTGNIPVTALGVAIMVIIVMS